MKTVLTLLITTLLLVGSTVFSQVDHSSYYNIAYAVPKCGTGVVNDVNTIKKALETYKSVFFPRTSASYLITGNLIIPAGCRLIFDNGAKLTGTGTIKGNATQIEGQGLIFASTLSFSGTFAGPYVDKTWFGSAADYTTFCGLTTLSTAIYMTIDSTKLGSGGFVTSAQAKTITHDTAVTIRSLLTTSALWNKIDSATTHLNMRSNNLLDVNAITVDNVIASGVIVSTQTYAHGIVGEKDTIDWTFGNNYTLALTDTVVVHFESPGYVANCILKITHANNTTEYPVTFTPTILWEGGTDYVSTSTANAVDIIKFWFDGTNWYGQPYNDFKP